MAKKQYKAVHRIMVRPKPPEYHEPGTVFLMEEKEGERLVSLGAAKAYEAKEETPNKPAAKKAPTSKKADKPAADEGGHEDLVG